MDDERVEASAPAAPPPFHMKKPGAPSSIAAPPSRIEGGRGTRKAAEQPHALQNLPDGPPARRSTSDVAIRACPVPPKWLATA